MARREPGGIGDRPPTAAGLVGACLPSESASSPPLLIAGRRRLGAVAGQPLAAAPCQAGRQCRLLDRARRKPRRAAARATSRPPVTRPPWNSSVSPALISTASESACSASVPGRAARPRPPRYRTGFLASNAAGAISCGAHVPPVRSGRGWVSTSPPEAQSWTAAPTAVTTRPPRHPRHRRRNADIPPALTDDLVQVADACSPYRDRRLVIGEPPRVWKLDVRDWSTDADDSGAAHHRDLPQVRSAPNASEQRHSRRWWGVPGALRQQALGPSCRSRASRLNLVGQRRWAQNGVAVVRSQRRTPQLALALFLLSSTPASKPSVMPKIPWPTHQLQCGVEL